MAAEFYKSLRFLIVTPFVNMTCQAAKHASPGTRKSVLMLKKGGKHAPSEIRKLTGVPKSTQNMWIQAAKASGDWDQLKPAPRKKRSDAGIGRKLTGRMHGGSDTEEN